MHLRTALAISRERAAYRPYYSHAMSPMRQKYVVCNLDGRGVDTYYVVWADTFNTIGELSSSEFHRKVLGFTDWIPIKPMPYQTVMEL